MILKLGKKWLNLRSDHPSILAAWQAIFARQWAKQVLEVEVPGGAVACQAEKEKITLEAIIGPDKGSPQDRSTSYADALRTEWGVCGPDSCRLRLPDQTEINFYQINSGSPQVTLSIPQQAFAAGRLEDITAIALAPLLRRAGYQLAHGFSLAFAPGSDQAWLGLVLAGRSGAGKTTTGLSLLGRQSVYLGNDIVILQATAGGVQLLPAFGLISASADTLSRLAHLPSSPQLVLDDVSDVYKEAHYPPSRHKRPYRIADQKGIDPPHTPLPESIPLKALFLLDQSPEWEKASGRTEISPLSAAVAAARLIEENVDHWDIEQLETQISFWTDLAGRVPLYRVKLGLDLAQNRAVFQEAIGAQ